MLRYRARHVVLGKGSPDLLCMPRAAPRRAGTNRGPGGMQGIPRAVCGGVPLAVCGGGTAGGMRGVPLAVLWIPRAAVNICEAVAGDPSRPPYKTLIQSFSEVMHFRRL